MITKYRQIKKQSRQNIFFSILLASLILIFIGFLAVSNFRISQKRTILNSQIKQLQEEIKAVEQKKQQLEARVYQASQEEYLEREARETFNLKKPGEQVVTILPPEETPQEEKETTQWWNPFGW